VLIVTYAKDEAKEPYGVWREELYTATAFVVSNRAFLKVFAVAFTKTGAVDFALALAHGNSSRKC